MKMSRIFSVILVIVLTFVMICGCVPRSAVENQAKTFTVTASFYPVYILTKNITQNAVNVEVRNLTSSYGECLHDYNILPDDLKTLENSDVLITNGGGMENFVQKATSQLPELNVIDSSQNFTGVKENNAHIWLSFDGAISQVKTISDELAQYDSKNRTIYIDNANRLIEKLKEQRAKMAAQLANVPNKNIVIANEGFEYIADDFGLNVVSQTQVEHDVEPTPTELANTIETIKQANAKVIIEEVNSADNNAVKIISEETGVRIIKLNAIINGFDDVNAYFKQMDENLSVLLEALK